MCFLQGNVAIGKTLKQVIAITIMSTLWAIMQIQSKNMEIKDKENSYHFSFQLSWSLLPQTENH